MIEFIDIHKSFGPKRVLKGVSLTVDQGQVLYVIGSSGAGKSVLVKHLVGLLRPDSGRIILDGRDVTWLSEAEFYAVRKKCAMVFQNSTLFDSMSILDNVALPYRKHFRLSRDEASRRALDKLALVQMEDAARRFPGDLGDGLRKRVAIARALTLEPEFVIFDEPTTGLDPVAAANVDALIRSLRNDTGVTAIVVSHDLRSIFSVADRIAMIYDGNIRLDGTPQEFRASDDPVVSQFINGRADGPMKI
ncbi:MAG: ABC transporter ATP-binding protein [Deltaproteobacteria bacterium HGW-Deltaproteobacteria-14]|nr:MAG: ABC transporter ATP-binding protein [Deltaproteobacteria bacterium HGW-Deltaproteobacteria-14]